MLHLLKTAKTISGRRREGIHNKDRGAEDKASSERRSSDTVQHPAKNEGRAGVRREPV